MIDAKGPLWEFRARLVSEYGVAVRAKNHMSSGVAGVFDRAYELSVKLILLMFRPLRRHIRRMERSGYRLMWISSPEYRVLEAYSGKEEKIV